MAIISQVNSNTYHDSVRLMRVSDALTNLDGVEQAIVAMGTQANKRVLSELGLLSEMVTGAGPNDLMIVVEAPMKLAAQDALAQADVILTESSQANTDGATIEAPPRTLEQARHRIDGANLMMISVAGQYAALEAAKALHEGMHVFMFSDNVTLEAELSLKNMASAKGLLMMGPGCGTSVINGVALGFANVLRRGPVGIVGASGTGLQEVTTIIDRSGVGISQAIGVGGRDLSETIGGIMMRQGIAMLAGNAETEVIVLISKPPHPSVTESMLDMARASSKPVIVNFLGDNFVGEKDGILFTSTIEDTARAAIQQAGGNIPDLFNTDSDALMQMAVIERQKLSDGQSYLRGLFSGGSLCDEAMIIMDEHLPGIYSNIALTPEYALESGWESREHSCIDMGEEEFTQGRPHPMIDLRLREERILKEAADPDVAVILLDVVLGYGSHDNPAGVLAETIRTIKAQATENGRYISVVAHVCGSEDDPQGLEQQENSLREAGALVLPTNAQAARVAVAIVSN